MMKSKFSSFILALLLVSIVFSMVFTSLATAEDNDFEPDNDEAIYLFPRTDSGEPADGFNYNYNYTDINVDEELLIYDDSLRDHEQYFDSEISLTANVVSVTSNSKHNRVEIAITAAGAYRWNDKSCCNPNDEIWLVNQLSHLGTIQSLIEAEIVDYKGSNIADPILDVEQGHNSANNFTTGSEGGDGGTEYWQKKAGEATLLVAESYIDAKTLGALRAAEFIYGVAEDKGLIETPSLGLEDDVNYCKGENANVRQTWGHETVFPEDEKFILERAHAVSTMVSLKIPNGDEYDLPDSSTLEISAENILGYAYEPDGEVLDTVDGAEASVEIPIKNADPDIQRELGTNDDHYDAGESSSVVSPVFQELKVTNPAQCTDVTYEVEIELRADWTDGFETLTYAWITHDEVLDKQVNIYVPEGTENEEVDIRYSVSTSEKYGGWELDPVSRYNLFKVTNEETDDGGGSGGGGGAPVHPTGGGTG